MRYKNTRIYQKSLELLNLSQLLLSNLPKGFSFLADQLRRASSSILLNFAEGNSKQSFRERKRYFITSKGSAYEVAAIFDVAKSYHVVDEQHYIQAQDCCDYLAAMLSKYR